MISHHAKYIGKINTYDIYDSQLGLRFFIDVQGSHFVIKDKVRLIAVGSALRNLSANRYEVIFDNGMTRPKRWEIVVVPFGQLLITVDSDDAEL